MAVGIGGGGFIGVALETTPGTYVAPTKYFPIMSESLKFVQKTKWRRPIRQTVDILGGVSGDANVEGDITVEAFTDVLPYFHRCSRATVVKTGVGPYTYTFTPGAQATAPDKTMSITVVRNGVTYGYVGCVVASGKYSIDDGTLMATFSMLGLDEASQSLPTPSFSTTVPFGAGQYDIQIPTSSSILEVDTFDFSFDDNAEPQFRLKNTGRGASFIKFGERDVKLSLARDFQNRTDYDAFKALTAQAITLVASKGASDSWTLTLPVSIKDTYEIGLSGQGDLLRASIAYNAVFDTSTSKPYGLVIVTPTENIP